MLTHAQASTQARRRFFSASDKDAMGILPTLVLGIIGSFVGGAIAAIFTDRKVLDFNTSGILLSIVGAIVALLIYNRIAASRGGSRTV